MLFSEDVRVVLHIRGSLLAVCVLLRLLESVPVHASLNATWEDNVRDDLLDFPSSFLFRGGDWDYGPEHGVEVKYRHACCPDPQQSPSGPEHWPGFCKTGKKQSPVNLVESDAESGTAEHLAFFNYETPAPLKLVNNGHTVSAQATDNCPRAVAAGKLPGVYYLDSFHFHWKSEHTVKKKQYPLELHLVHVNEKYKSVAEALGDSQGLAVIGVFFEETKSDNGDLNPLLEGVKKVAAKVESTAEVADFKIAALLPESEYFYRYDGSLTTPNCDEVVVWTVIDASIRISTQQLGAFRDIQDAHNHNLKLNFRPVQPVNDRTVVRYKSGTSRVLTPDTIIAPLLVALLSPHI